MPPLLALTACLLVTFVMGSIHAFGVLLEPIEAASGVGRTAASLIYSVGLVTVTLAVFVGHRLYRMLAAPMATLLAGLLACGGLLLASLSGWVLLIVGYGLLFGFASGLGYGFALHAASRAYPDRKGAALGAVTACYAAGALAFSFLLSALLDRAGLAGALWGAALVVAAVMLLASLLLWRSGLETRPGRDSARAESVPLEVSHCELARFWLAYGAGVFAGLMVIAHAVAIVAQGPGGAELAALSVPLIALANAVCGIAAGWLSDRMPMRAILAAIPLISGALLVGLAVAGDPVASLFFLTLVGGAYGALIAVYPPAVARRFGDAHAARVYGRIFTAWGVAGLVAPVVAGALYELSGDYRWPLLTAAFLAVVSATAALTLSFEPHRRPDRP